MVSAEPYIMENKEAYNNWSATYDSVANKTRDVEALAFRNTLSSITFSNVIELGCGTGKNTLWLAEKGNEVLAVDFSEEMIDVARRKISKPNVSFNVADITKPWDFANQKISLITCSLILEHIENIDPVFSEAGKHLDKDGYFYVGELHPFKQYQGSKARFDLDGEQVTLDCFTHHVSDYMSAAAKNNLSCVSLTEWFDEEEKSSPRIVAFLFQKKDPLKKTI